MSRDYVLVCEDGQRYSFNNLTTQNWLNGHAPGAEEVLTWLLERAICLFRMGKIEEAVEMRSLADEARKSVVPRLEKCAKEHEREHPELLPACAPPASGEPEPSPCSGTDACGCVACRPVLAARPAPAKEQP